MHNCIKFLFGEFIKNYIINTLDIIRFEQVYLVIFDLIAIYKSGHLKEEPLLSQRVKLPKITN